WTCPRRRNGNLSNSGQGKWLVPIEQNEVGPRVKNLRHERCTCSWWKRPPSLPLAGSQNVCVFFLRVGIQTPGGKVFEPVITSTLQKKVCSKISNSGARFHVAPASGAVFAIHTNQFTHTHTRQPALSSARSAAKATNQSSARDSWFSRAQHVVRLEGSDRLRTRTHLRHRHHTASKRTGLTENACCRVRADPVRHRLGRARRRAEEVREADLPDVAHVLRHGVRAADPVGVPLVHPDQDVLFARAAGGVRPPRDLPRQPRAALRDCERVPAHEVHGHHLCGVAQGVCAQGPAAGLHVDRHRAQHARGAHGRRHELWRHGRAGEQQGRAPGLWHHHDRAQLRRAGGPVRVRGEAHGRGRLGAAARGRGHGGRLGACVHDVRRVPNRVPRAGQRPRLERAHGRRARDAPAQRAAAAARARVRRRDPRVQRLCGLGHVPAQLDLARDPRQLPADHGLGHGPPALLRVHARRVRRGLDALELAPARGHGHAARGHGRVQRHAQTPGLCVPRADRGVAHADPHDARHGVERARELAADHAQRDEGGRNRAPHAQPEGPRACAPRVHDRVPAARGHGSAPADRPGRPLASCCGALDRREAHSGLLGGREEAPLQLLKLLDLRLELLVLALELHVHGEDAPVRGRGRVRVGTSRALCELGVEPTELVGERAVLSTQRLVRRLCAAQAARQLCIPLLLLEQSRRLELQLVQLTLGLALPLPEPGKLLGERLFSVARAHGLLAQRLDLDLLARQPLYVCVQLARESRGAIHGASSYSLRLFFLCRRSHELFSHVEELSLEELQLLCQLASGTATTVTLSDAVEFFAELRVLTCKPHPLALPLGPLCSERLLRVKERCLERNHLQLDALRELGVSCLAYLLRLEQLGALLRLQAVNLVLEHRGAV
ncbi:hypothetical protein PybrP1_006996, partial [[Pythium] brassicae (nom. inval.)]